MSGSRDNSGIIAKNDRKEKDTHPDIKGQATINGVAYWVSGWHKTNDRGTFYSLAFEAKEQPAAKPASTRTDDADSIPF